VSIVDQLKANNGRISDRVVDERKIVERSWGYEFEASDQC